MRWIVASVVAALLLGGGVGEAAGQSGATRWDQPLRAERYLDYYFSLYRPSWSANQQQDAVGGRLMWSLTPLAEPGWRTVLDRVLLGGYLTRSPEAMDRSETLRYGAEADFLLAAEPLAGRISPFLSLGLGAVRVDQPGRFMSSLPHVDTLGEEPARVDVPALSVMLPPRSRTELSVTPGIGARVRLLPWLDFRGDARQVIDFWESGIERNLEFSGGLSVRG